jgi:hypothetical protein
VRREQHDVLRQTQPENEEDEGNGDERGEIAAVLDAGRRELEHQDLEEKVDQQELPEVPGEDVPVAQDEQDGAE